MITLPGPCAHAVLQVDLTIPPATLTMLEPCGRQFRFNRTTPEQLLAGAEVISLYLQWADSAGRAPTSHWQENGHKCDNDAEMAAEYEHLLPPLHHPPQREGPSGGVLGNHLLTAFSFWPTAPPPFPSPVGDSLT